MIGLLTKTRLRTKTGSQLRQTVCMVITLRRRGTKPPKMLNLNATATLHALLGLKNVHNAPNLTLDHCVSQKWFNAPNATATLHALLRLKNAHNAPNLTLDHCVTKKVQRA